LVAVYVRQAHGITPGDEVELGDMKRRGVFRNEAEERSWGDYVLAALDAHHGREVVIIALDRFPADYLSNLVSAHAS